MIRVIYNKPELYSLWRVIWVSLLFIAINYIVFISFMNVCFETLAIRQPVALLTITFFLFAADLVIQVFMTRKPLTIGNVLDVVVLFCLILSFSLFGLFKKLVFIQIVALFKLQDTVYFNVLVYNLVRKHNNIRKFYVIMKISYWVVVMGHLVGCIFYAVDNYLIKVEYFGSLAENPNLYYQGSQHVFTSIYALSEIQRYIYAIYFSFALLSTVAFGDIIGHNYLQDVMISFFLILSTIGISLIIEQMYIVFRRQKTMRYQLVSRLKYVSEYIKTQQNISTDFRHDLINYMINSQWKEMTCSPNLNQLTLKLTQSLFSQSILSKTSDPLPLIIKTSFMPLLKSKYFPANYFLIDNNRLQNHLDGRIILKGKLNIGYTRQLLGRQYVEAECISYGFEELVIGTNYLKKFLSVQLVQQAQVFVLNDDEFSRKILQLKDYINEYLPTPIEFYQISIDDIITRNKENTFCSSCKLYGHNLVDCPKFHYNPRITTNNFNSNPRDYSQHHFTSNLYIKHYNHQRQEARRKQTRSRKETSRKSLNQMKRQKKGDQNLQIHFQIFRKMFNQNNLFQNLLEKTIVNYTEDMLINSSTDQIDSYHVWKIYCPEGRL